MPLWLQVLLALVAPAAALGGVWLGGRLSAGSAEQQWRRDRLLQFCADLLAACHDAVAEAGRIHDQHEADPSTEPVTPHETVQRVVHAAGSVRLLSEELAETATNFTTLTLGVVAAAVQDDETFTAAQRPAAEAEGEFQRAAHDQLTRARPAIWTLLRQRSRAWAPGAGLLDQGGRKSPARPEGRPGS